jgi:hypothetical protein
MALKLHVPKRIAPSLAEFLRLTPQELAAFLRGIREEQSNRALKELTKTIAARLFLDSKRLEEIVELLTGMQKPQESLGQSVESFIAELRAAMEVSGKDDLRPPDWSIFQQAVAEALPVLTDQERVAQWEKLESFRNLQHGWDSYEAEPPNEVAMANARRVLHILWSSGTVPPIRTISPSVEGGIGIVFAGSHNRYADIECFNDGDILAITSNGETEPSVWSPGTEAGGLHSAVERISSFLDD